MDRINKAKLDPLPLYDNIEVILKREDKPVPEREDDETDEHYRERLIAVNRAVCVHVFIICSIGHYILYTYWSLLPFSM